MASDNGRVKQNLQQNYVSCILSFLKLTLAVSSAPMHGRCTVVQSLAHGPARDARRPPRRAHHTYMMDCVSGLSI